MDGSDPKRRATQGAVAVLVLLALATALRALADEGSAAPGRVSAAAAARRTSVPSGPGPVPPLVAPPLGEARRTPAEASRDPVPIRPPAEATAPGVLRGRVVDGYGAPQPDLPLVATSVRVEGPNDWSRIRALEREGSGPVRRHGRTGADGAFEVRGLDPGPWRVHTPCSLRPKEWILLTGMAGVLPDGAPHELVHTVPCLEVRLLDEDGRPWSGAAPACHGFGEEDPRVPRVIVQRADPEWGIPTSEREPTVRFGTAGRAVCDVQGGAWYLVRTLGSGFGHASRLVHVPDGVDTVRIAFRASTPLPTGRIVARVLPPEGVLPVEFEEDRAIVLLEDVRSSAVVERETLPEAEAVVVFDVPVGRYRVVAEGTRSWSGWCGSEVTLRRWGRREREAFLDAGQEVEVELRLEEGARLEVDFRDVEASGLDPDGRSEDDRSAAPERVHLELRRPSRRPVVVRSWRTDSRWIPGTDRVSARLPSGAFELVATYDDGREERRRVSLEPGETTRVELPSRLAR